MRHDERVQRLAASERRIEGLKEAAEDLGRRRELLRNPARQTAGQDWPERELALMEQTLAQRVFELDLERIRRANFVIMLEGAVRRLELAELWERRVRTLLRARRSETGDTAQGRVHGDLDLAKLDFFDQVVALTRQLEQEADSLSEPQHGLLEA